VPYALTTYRAETYNLEFTVDNLFDIQIDVANRIASALELEVTPTDRTRLEARATQNLKAYESYLLGRVAWAKRTSANLEESIGHLRRATELDPTFGLAYSALAEAFILQPFFSDAYETDVALARAEASARRALSLDPNLGQAHAALALVREFQFDWVRAEEQFLLAIDKTPDYATAHHWYANLLSRRGRFVEGLAHIRKAYQLDPLSLIINQDIGYNLHLSGQNEAALRQYERTLQLDPEFATTTLVYAWALILENRFDDARTVMERWAVLTGRNPATLSGLVDAARAHYESGLPQELPEGLDVEGLSIPYFMPHIYLSLGHREQALDLLEQALDDGQFGILMGLSSPVYDGVRQDPRFVTVAQRVGIGLYPEGT
jgi:tetratricopeptide (TPR) repeat protein